MPLDVQCRMYTYEPNAADVIQFVRKISPHIKSYTRLMLPSAIMVEKTIENKIENDHKNENDHENENENESDSEEIHDLKEMNENRQYDNFTHTQFTINSDSYSFDSPSDMRKMKKITSTSSSLSNKNICDVRGCRQDDDVPQAKGVKTKTGTRKETDKRAVSGTKTKAKSKAGVTRVCTCHPIAWSLITSSCLSRGKI